MAKTKTPETPVADAPGSPMPDGERIAAIKTVARRLAAAGDGDVPLDGINELAQFLIVRGYSAEVAQAALDRFASAGFWKAPTGEEFGDRPRKLAI